MSFPQRFTQNPSPVARGQAVKICLDMNGLSSPQMVTCNSDPSGLISSHEVSTSSPCFEILVPDNLDGAIFENAFSAAFDLDLNIGDKAVEPQQQKQEQVKKDEVDETPPPGLNVRLAHNVEAVTMNAMQFRGLIHELFPNGKERDSLLHALDLLEDGTRKALLAQG